MLYNIEIRVTIQGSDNNSIYASPQAPQGPIVAVKGATFAGIGSNKEAAIAEAHSRLVEFLEHEATVEDGPRIPKIISPFSKREREPKPGTDATES